MIHILLIQCLSQLNIGKIWVQSIFDGQFNLNNVQLMNEYKVGMLSLLFVVEHGLRMCLRPLSIV